MYRTSHVSLFAIVVLALSFHAAAAVGLDDEVQTPAEISWHTDYGQAVKAAREENKMMFVFFCRPGENQLRDRFECEVLAEPEVAEKLQDHVCVKLPLDTEIREEGEELLLIEHSSFKRLKGRQGVAILDFAHKDAPYYGWVVSTFTLDQIDSCFAEQMSIILDLPPGTPQERMGSYEGRTAPGDSLADEESLEAMKREEQGADDELRPRDVRGWRTNYAKAVKKAKRRGKMLLVRFYGSRLNRLCRCFERETLADPKVRKKLREYVRVRLPLRATIEAEGQTAPMCSHPAFEEMLGRPGVAILDFVERDSELYGRVVSTFPITRTLQYTPEQMLVILGLPRATLTQRTLIYAVRIHPEKPASTGGQIDAHLLEEAESHSAYQARIRLQGHHRWESRFHQISAELPPELTAIEVCAESWPGERLVEAAIECVRCWRFSSGHWSAVRAPHRFYGYDMKRGSNGIWYATGIFGGK